MDSNSLILIILLYSKIYTSQSPNPTCTKNKEEKKKFTCTLENVVELQNLKCTTPSQTCTVTQPTHRITNTDDSTGTLTFTIEIVLLKYTKDPLEVSFTHIDSTTGDTSVGSSVSLKIDFENNEIPKIECRDVNSNDNNFGSSVDCTIYVPETSDTLSTTDGTDCVVTIPIPNPTSAEAGILYTKTYSLTISDSSKTCDRTCSVTLEIAAHDPSGNKISSTLSHTSKCNGESIDCSNHNPSTRQITCRITIPYEYVKIKFSSSNSHVKLDTNSEEHQSTNDKTAVQRVLTYTITNLQSSQKQFKINYDVIQKGSTITYSVKNNPDLTYILKDDEKPNLECKSDTTQKSLQYYELAYKCRARSFFNPITFSITDDAFKISPKTSQNGVNKNNLFYHEEFKLKLTRKDIKCNKEESFNLFFQEGSDQRTTTITQKIECPKIDISQQTHESSNRRLNWKLSARYSFTITEITSNNIKISLNIPILVPRQNSEGIYEVVCSGPYESTDISQNTIIFDIKIKYEHSQDFKQEITTQSYTWTRNTEESPSLNCVIKGNEIPADFKIFVVSCDALTISESFQLTSSTAHYNVVASRVKKLKYKGIYKWKKYEVVVQDEKPACGVDKAVVIKFQDTSELLSQEITRKANCPSPTVLCHSHDLIKRTMSCKINVIYPVTRVNIISVNSNVVITPDKADPNKLMADTKISYSVTNPLDERKKFKIKFEFKQSSKLIHKIETPQNSFELKKDEKSQISCNIKNEQMQETREKQSYIYIYICSIVTKTSSLALNVPPGYQINPDKTGEISQGSSFYRDSNFEVSLTSKIIKCGHSEMVRIHFTEGGHEYSTLLNHTTKCKEPIIKCEKHDMIEKIITCDFEINYDFNEIKLSVIQNVVTLETDSIKSSLFNNKALKDHKIKYKINDRSVTSSHIIISFDVFQNTGNLAHTKSIGLRYFVKSDEHPSLSCRKSSLKKKIRFESELFDCDIVSYSPKIELRTSTAGFKLSPTEVQGNFKNGIYTHENFPLTVTPDEVICNDEKDVTIFFTERSNDIRFVIKHTVICPDPVINCNHHDNEKREIKCDIEIEFPFTSINLQTTSTSDGIIKLKSQEAISYDVYKRTTPYKHTVEYELKNLKIANHHFDIRFTVVQNGVELFRITKTFQYVLKNHESPHILCNQKLTQSETEHESITYSCNLLSQESLNSLLPEPNTFSLTNGGLNSASEKEIYKFTNIDIQLKPSTPLCSKQIPVKIKASPDVDGLEYSVTHTINCPEPIIDCKTHNLVTKIITCSIKIDFTFKEITITTSSSSIEIPEKNDDKDNSKIVANGQGKYSQESHKIKYTITNYRSQDFNFDINFNIIQTDNSNIFQMIRKFRYSLSSEQRPYIKCVEEPQQEPLNFYQIKYNCEIVSMNKQVDLLINPTSYKIDKIFSNGNDYEGLYKHENVKITIEPIKVICDLKQTIEIVFIDLDNKQHSEYASHSTKCPDPTILNQQPQDSSQEVNRKVTINVQAEYEYKVKSVSSTTPSVQLIPEIIAGTKIDDKWTSVVTIKYQPNDWSIDSHKFKVIIEVGQEGEWRSSILSNEYTLNLNEEEKSQISCESMESETEDFTQKYFTCQAITRQSIIMLNSSDKNYKIVSATGSSNENKNVYQWNDYKIAIQDVAITCNTIKSFDAFFVEYTERYKSSITMSITCPVPKLTMAHHDTENRIILYNVESEIPSFRTKINYSGNFVTLSKSESVIKKKGKKWYSSISVTYTVDNLLNTQFKIPFSFGIEQHQESIGSVALSFDYVLRENEKRQIKCKVNTNRTLLQFSVTEYICYVVGIQSLSITVNPTSYKLSYETTESLQFVNIRKWENVSVRVEDASIFCNETVNLTLTNHDGGDKFSTIVQHTTICDKIDGECYINHNDVAYIFCNFTSNTKFNLRNFTCSNAFNCSSSKDVEKVSEKWNEFAFELTPLSTETYLEFDFHITLEHSIHSPVPFIFKLAYSTEPESIEIQKPPTAKIVTSFSNSIIYLAIFAVLCTYVLLRKSKHFLNPREHCEETSFRNL